MLRGDDLEPAPEPEKPHAAARTVTLRPVIDGDPPGISVQASWRLRATKPGFFSGILAGPGVEIESATLAGRPAPTVRTPAGTLVVAYLDGPATLKLDAFLPAPVTEDGGTFDLQLMSAVRGTIGVDHPELSVEVTRTPEDRGAARDATRVWTGASNLGLSLRRPSATPSDKGPLLLAHAGLGITVGEGEVKLRSRVVWTLRRGSVEALALRVSGLSEDLEVHGAGIESWDREGDTIRLRLAAPVSTRVEAELSWSQPLRDVAEASFEIPRVAPEGTFRSDAALQLARDGEIEVVPELSGWTGLAGDELPEWGRGLVEGTPTAAYERGRTTGETGTLALLRFVPVPGPAVVVDVADYTIATSQDGRLLARAKYQVRNERAAYLRIEPPEGVEIIGARVGADTALPARTEDGAWLLPLKRSLETVDGMLTFPVEVALLGESEAWRRRERRTVTLPTVGAPIAASRVTLYLPPRFRSRLEAGDGAVVDEFTEGEGITYGLSIGGEEVEQVDALFQAAVDDYRKGDFEASQTKLDQLGNVGASNANVERLQSNLDLVTGKEESGDSDGKKDAIARRVKEQAKARAVEEFDRQRELEEQADEAYRRGDYEEAERRFEEAIELGGKLEKLEQKESVDTARRNVKLAGKLGEVKASKKRKIAFKTKSKDKRKIGSRLRNRRRSRGRRFSGSDAAGVPSSVSTPTSGPVPDDSFDSFDELEEEDGAGGDDVTVYDFEDDDFDVDDQARLDNLDGELANEQGQTAQAGEGGVAVSGVQSVPEGATIAEPEPVDIDEDGVVDMPDEPEPIAEPEPIPDAPPPRPATEEAAEKRSFGSTIRGGFRRVFRGGGRRRASRRRAKHASVVRMDEPPVPPALEAPGARDPAEKAPQDPKPRFIERLPAPEATASSLSVVIPAIGEEVLYQTLLIEAGQPQTIVIDAKRRLRRR